MKTTKMKSIKNHKSNLFEKVKTVPNPSAWIPEEAKIIFTQIATSLLKNDKFLNVDLFRIEQLSIELITFRKATEKLQEEGEVIIFPSGAKQMNPYVTIRNKASQNINILSKSFGLSIRDRELIPNFNIEKKEEDILDILMKRAR